MGNTLIQDSATGHIMGLSEGFVPVGLKEHGGIMYIASVNKEGKGEIGTIPSPILTLSQNYPDVTDSREATLVHENGPDHNLTILSDYKIAPGEKFLIGLDLNITPDYTWYNKPMITCFDGDVLVRGMYNIKLYTVYDTNSVCLDKLISTPQKYCTVDGNLNTSNYWFLSSYNIANIDTNKTYLAKEFKTYPGNIPAGRLAIKVELENIDSFSLMKSIQTQGVNAGKATFAPRVTKDADKNYILDFTGFDYQTSSSRFVGKVEYCLYDQKTKQPLYNTNKQQYETVQVDEHSTLKIRDPETLEWHYQIRQTTKPVIPQPALFSYNIGSSSESLNNWYQIVVTYYDQFDGKIDTYKYSFNPYHVLILEENYSLNWVGSMIYPQYYNWVENDMIKKPRTSDRITIQQSTIPLIKNSVDFNYRPGYSITTGSGVIDIHEASINIPSADTDPGDNYPYTIISNSLNYQYLYNSSDNIPIEWHLKMVSQNYINDIQNINTIKPDMVYSSFAGTLTKEPSVHGETIAFNIDMLQPLQIKSDESLFIQSDQLTDRQTLDSMPSISSSSGEYINWINTQCAIGSTYTIKSQQFNALNINFQFQFPPYSSMLKAYRINDTNEIYDTEVTLNYTIPQCTIQFESEVNFKRRSSYNIIPNFLLYGDSDTKFNIVMGLDRNGNPQPAWTLGKSLLTPVKLKKSTDQSSFVETVEYLPATHTITQVIYAGTYLLNLNAYSQTGQLSIEIQDDTKYCEIANWYFTPQLIYLSKDTRITITWSNIEKLRNIGLYRLANPVWTTKREIFGEGSTYTIVDYQDSTLDVTSEVIIPLQASYYEDTECLGESYKYYIGPTDASMTDRHRLANADILKFVYQWDSNNATETSIGVIPNYNLNNKLTYRYVNDELSNTNARSQSN